MAILPIIERELRVGARNKAMLRARTMVPFMGTVVLIFFAWSTRFGVPTQAVAKQIFYFCFIALFGGCLLSGIKTTADAISSEKREGTLGFLFLTDLRGHDVILGKLFSSSIAGLYSFLSLLPVISVIFLFGGVEWGVVFRVVVTSGNAMLFSLSAGLLASVLVVQEKHARNLTAALVMGVTFLGPLIGALVLWAGGSWRVVQASGFWQPYLLSSPIGAFTSSISNAFGIGWSSFLISNVILLAIGMIFLVLACYLVRRTWQQKADKARGESWWARWKKKLEGTQDQKACRRAKMLDENPIFWLANRERWKGWDIWGWLGLIAIGFLGLGLYFGSKLLLPPACVFFIVVTNMFLKGSMIGESGRWIARDRQSGVLELILTTPMRVEELLEGQRIALSRIYRWPFIVGGALQLVVAVLCLLANRNEVDTVGKAILCAGGAAIWLVIMAVDFRAIGWVGMWVAISATPVAKVRPETVRAILFQPWWVFYILMVLISPFARGDSWKFGIALWPLVTIGMALIQQRRAKKRLLAEFRIRAMERYGEIPAHPWWTKVGRFGAQLFFRIRSVFGGTRSYK